MKDLFNSQGKFKISVILQEAGKKLKGRHVMIWDNFILRKLGQNTPNPKHVKGQKKEREEGEKEASGEEELDKVGLDSSSQATGTSTTKGREGTPSRLNWQLGSGGSLQPRRVWPGSHNRSLGFKELHIVLFLEAHN